MGGLALGQGLSPDRCLVGGQWQALSRRGDGLGGQLAVDSEGSVWATQESQSELGGWGWLALRRAEETAWTAAGTPPEPYAMPVDVVADPNGGMWSLCDQCAPSENPRAGVLRYQGQSWQVVGGKKVQAIWPQPGRERLGLGYMEGRQGWLTVARDGTAWYAGLNGALALKADGATRKYGPKQGLVRKGAVIQGIVAASGRVLALDTLGVLRLEGRQFRRLWRDPLSGAGSRPLVRWSLLATSAEEAWALQARSGSGVAYGAGTIDRYRNGRWRAVARNACAPTRAGDGAVWTRTAGGLLRVKGNGKRIVARKVRECPQFPGANGSVWTLAGDQFGGPESDEPRNQPDAIVSYSGSGKRRSLGHPKGFDATCLLGAGPDGTVWAGAGGWASSNGARECESQWQDATAGRLAFWTGNNWRKVDAPQGRIALAVSQGTTWAAATSWADESPTILWYRFDATGWTHVATQSSILRLEEVHADGTHSVLPRPGGGAWLHYNVTLACVDAGGQASQLTTTGTSIRTGTTQYSIATDGSVWALGPQVARISAATAG